MLENLFELLEIALADKQKAKTSLPNDIGRLINKHFKSKENLMRVDSMLKARAPRDTESKSFTNLVEWPVGGDLAKKANIASTPEAVVDNAAPDENEQIFDNFLQVVGSNDIVPQTLLDNFGTVDQIKDMCKSSGFDLDYSLDGLEFLQILIDVVKDAQP